MGRRLLCIKGLRLCRVTCTYQRNQVKHLPKLLAVLFVLAFTGRAEAQILTFNEMAPTDNPILGTVVCGPTVGFLFSSDHFHVTGGDFLEPFTSNGTSHIGYEAGRGFPIRMERLGGGPSD